MRRATSTLFFTLFVLNGFSQSVLPDYSFDLDGHLTTAIGTSNNYDRANAIAVQTDGKIVIAGSSYNGTDDDFAILRYNSDGSLDSSFDGDGIVTLPVGNGNDILFALELQSDTKIVVAGISSTGTNTDFTVLRLNSDGSLDNTFDGDGIAITDIGGDMDFCYAVAIQNDGKIVAAGSYYYNYAAVRYNTDGSLDYTFNSDGIATTDFNGDVDYAFSVALQADNKILVAGESYTGAQNDFAILRYNTDGTLDTSFSADGKVKTDFGSYDQAKCITIQQDGKILVGGRSSYGFSEEFAMARYTTSGNLDTSFHTDGMVTTDIQVNSDDCANSIVACADGKILLAGESYSTLNGITQFALVRYTSNGTEDNLFDYDGIVTTNFGGGMAFGHDITLQTDNKILIAGTYSEGNDQMAVARFNNSAFAGVDDLSDHQPAVKLYPNPAEGDITLEWNEKKTGVLKIYNSLGEIILHEELNKTTTISLKSTGIYFVCVYNEQGEIIFSGKLLKK